MIPLSYRVIASALSITLIPAASAAPEFFVDVSEGTANTEVTFSHVTLGPQQTVFDTLIHPAQLSNLQLSLASSSAVRIIEGNSARSAISGSNVDSIRQLFTEDMSEAFLDNNLNHYLGFFAFSFDDTFSYELEFAAPLLDDTPTADDDFTELFFTAREENSYMLIEALEAPGGAPLAGSNPFLVDTNGWIPARDVDGGGSVPQLNGTALYVRGVDLSMLGVSQAQYFRLSSVSAATPGVTDLNAHAAASGLSVTAIQTVAVPEPSSTALALVGLGAFATRRRRI